MLGGGCGQELAHWIVHGRPEKDMYSYDIRQVWLEPEAGQLSRDSRTEGRALFEEGTFLEIQMISWKWRHQRQKGRRQWSAGAMEEHLAWAGHSLCVQDLLAWIIPDSLSTSKGFHHSMAQMGRLRLGRWARIIVSV